jgi:hypothetical protein
VYVNGHLVKKVSPRGTARNKVVIPIVGYSSRRSIKVRIVTTKEGRVIIDGLGVSAS